MAIDEAKRAQRRPPPTEVTVYSARAGTKLLIGGFAALILVGALLLMLPIATEGEALKAHEAFFTATSAATVTGLTLFNTETTFSMFGELVILLLIQIGGIGFITISILLFRLIGRHVRLGERNLLRSVWAAHRIGGSGKQLVAAITGVVFGLELLGALPLWLGWKDTLGVGKAAYYAIFHSISSFCNAGFDLFHGVADPLVELVRTSPLMLLAMAALITIGTMGITAVFDAINMFRGKRPSLHTKLIFPFLIGITVIGTLVLLVEHTVSGLSTSLVDIGDSFFTVVSSRTAGITLTDITVLGPASLFVLVVMMFIGGAPASMGGGIGLTTLAVMMLAFFNGAKGNRDVRAWGRIIPTETIYKALAILGVSTTLVAVTVIAVLIIDGGEAFATLFEVVSAYSNTGYSLGVTSTMSLPSQILLIITMFLGRLGPLTLVVALAQRSRHTQVSYPEERIIIG